MRTVLRGTAGRFAVGVALVAGIAGVAVPPALAAGHPSAGRPAAVRSGHPGVEIGTAVAYVRDPDGTIRRTRP